MRRALLGTLVIAVLVAGCGSASRPGQPSNPLASELSYLPTQTPVVISLQTAAHSEIGQSLANLEKRFPTAGLAKIAALQKLQQEGINYNTDVRPLLGNPIIVGTAGASTASFSQNLVIVWVTHSAGALTRLLSHAHVHRTGSYQGDKLYAQGAGTVLAVSGATVVLARGLGTLEVAIDRHAHSQGLLPAQREADLQGLDPNAALAIFGDLQGVLAAPSATKARQDPWVAALRSYGVTLGSNSTGITFGFRLNTDSSALTAAQIPITSGTAAPSLVPGLPIQVGIRDPAQLINFVLAAVQRTSAHGRAQIAKQEARLRSRAGVNLTQFLAQFTGNLVVDSDSRSTLARVGVADPAKVARTLQKLAAAHGSLGANTLTAAGPGVYSFVTSHRHALMGVVGDNLVLAVPPHGGTVHASALRSFAAAPAAASGASGSVAFRIAVAQLITLTGNANGSAAVHQILSMLGDLTGSMSATPSALTGAATLALK